MNNKFLIPVIALILLGGGVFAWQQFRVAEVPTVEPVKLQKETIIPEQVRNWIENSLKFDLTDFANAKEFGGKQYLFVRSGSGFRGERLVQITDVNVVEQEVVVRVKFTKPSPAQQITLDDLYDVAYINATGLPVRFIPVADEEIFIKSLASIHYLPDIVAQSRTIKVFAPAPDDVVRRKFSVSGVANVFEATVPYRLLDADRNTLVDGFITALQRAPGFTREPVIIEEHLRGPEYWLYFAFDRTYANHTTPRVLMRE